VIGGLLFATAATLFIVPVIFSLMHKRKAASSSTPKGSIPGGELHAA
jgi:hypothetical protein